MQVLSGDSNEDKPLGKGQRIALISVVTVPDAPQTAHSPLLARKTASPCQERGVTDINRHNLRSRQKSGLLQRFQWRKSRSDSVTAVARLFQTSGPRLHVLGIACAPQAASISTISAIQIACVRAIHPGPACAACCGRCRLGATKMEGSGGQQRVRGVIEQS